MSHLGFIAEIFKLHLRLNGILVCEVRDDLGSVVSKKILIGI